MKVRVGVSRSPVDKGFYRASDALLRHRATIEQTLFARVSALFELDWSVTLDDLTNTFFEGAAAANAKPAGPACGAGAPAHHQAHRQRAG